jgi:hypothetical protein
MEMANETKVLPTTLNYLKGEWINNWPASSKSNRCYHPLTLMLFAKSTSSDQFCHYSLKGPKAIIMHL